MIGMEQIPLDPDLHETTFRGNPGRQNTLQWINILDSSCKLCPLQTALAEPRFQLRSTSSIQDPVSVTLLTSPCSSHLTTCVEMRKQCPSCLSNKSISPLHRWGLLMRDRDGCLSTLPSSQQQRKHHSGKSVLHSDCSLLSKHNSKPSPVCLTAPWVVKSLVRQWLSLSLKSIITIYCQHHCSQWMPHLADLALLTLLELPKLFP